MEVKLLNCIEVTPYVNRIKQFHSNRNKGNTVAIRFSSATQQHFSPHLCERCILIAGILILTLTYSCEKKPEKATFQPRKSITVSVGKTPILSSTQQDTLLAIARRSIQYYLDSTSRFPPLPSVGDPVLNEMRGCMVNVRKGDAVRGATGYILPVKPLAVGVMEMAIKAVSGYNSPSPLKREEFDSTIIQLTVVSNLEPVTSDSAISVGSDGLIISRGNNVGGIIMPEEVTGYPSAAAAIDTLLARSKTAKEEWQRNEVAIQSFTVQVFREELPGVEE